MIRLSLKKYDPSVWDAIDRLRSALGEGDLADDLEKLTSAMLTDTMVKGMGNKAAYKRHLETNRDRGVHVHVDLNDFGQINKIHGEQVGDEAIIKFGNLAHQLSRKYGGKSFRNGGDEFKFHFHDPETAHRFVRELQSQLESVPKIGGTHNLSASIGIGRNFDEAEQAVIQAKSKLGPMDRTGKRKNKHALGEAPTVVHSAFGELDFAPQPESKVAPTAPISQPVQQQIKDIPQPKIEAPGQQLDLFQWQTPSPAPTPQPQQAQQLDLFSQQSSGVGMKKSQIPGLRFRSLKKS